MYVQANFPTAQEPGVSQGPVKAARLLSEVAAVSKEADLSGIAVTEANAEYLRGTSAGGNTTNALEQSIQLCTRVYVQHTYMQIHTCISISCIYMVMTGHRECKVCWLQKWACPTCCQFGTIDICRAC